MSGCVSVIGPPSRICCRNIGTTEPEEHNTLPKRTIANFVPGLIVANACNTISDRRLLAPMMLVGRTALSVLTSTKSDTPFAAAARAALSVPSTLFLTPAAGGGAAGGAGGGAAAGETGAG